MRLLLLVMVMVDGDGLSCESAREKLFGSACAGLTVQGEGLGVWLLALISTLLLLFHRSSIFTLQDVYITNNLATQNHIYKFEFCLTINILRPIFIICRWTSL